jgi:cold shock protein
MYEGKVKFFNNEKGYGFIEDTNSAQEFFVHVSGLLDQVKAGDPVVFDLAEGPKGFSAVEVRIK